MAQSRDLWSVSCIRREALIAFVFETQRQPPPRLSLATRRMDPVSALRLSGTTRSESPARYRCSDDMRRHHSIVKQPSRVRSPANVTYRPVSRPAPGNAGLFGSSSPRRGVRNDWAESRARGVRMWKHTDIPPAFRHAGSGSTHRRRTTSRTGPRKQVFACVPHAMVLSACNSQRRHAPGALTECLASPHCWVLGPPTPSAGRRPFTTSQVTRHRHATRTKGPQTRRVRRIPLRAGDETGAPLHRSGTDARIFLAGPKSTLVSDISKRLCATCAPSTKLSYKHLIEWRYPRAPQSRASG